MSNFRMMEKYGPSSKSPTAIDRWFVAVDGKTVIPQEQLEQTRNYGEILASFIYGLAMRVFTALRRSSRNWDCLGFAIG